jgi:diguanylate cyclase (GGDEF)-like protein
MALAGIGAAALAPGGGVASVAAVIGFAIILATAVIELRLPAERWLVLEETLAPVSALLIVGLAPERVTVWVLLWLCCVACGVLARGGRQHWYGRAVLLLALALPIALHGRLTLGYGLVCLATIVLLLTCGRVTRELRALLDHARHEADHDGLTGVLSRGTFRAELERLAAAAAAAAVPSRGAAGEMLALLLVDLDGFGAVNKSSGHAAGDAVLVQVARAIGETLGGEATVGRLGGDEFAALVAAADPVAAGEQVLARLLEAPGVRASAGMAMLGRDGDDAEGLLRAVDVALRVAKGSRRGGLSVYAGESISRLGPGGAREALERLIAGEGQRVVVQPIVSVPDATVHAYEALARFDARGTSSPLHWFALADELAMRDRLELACLRAALRVMPDRPAGTAFTINLSAPLLLDPRVTAALDALPALDGLIIEVTENSLLDDSAEMRAEMARLTARGARFAVDDMGAGYSGLRQITTLRPSYLKLDRSLVTGIDRDPDRGALVGAMVGYARQTGGHLVAEGVETEAELAALVALGVPLVQGFHLARPDWPWPRLHRPATAAASAPGVGSLTAAG